MSLFLYFRSLDEYSRMKGAILWSSTYRMISSDSMRSASWIACCRTRRPREIFSGRQMLIPGMVNFTVQGMRSAPIESPANALILSKRAHTVPSGMLWSDEAKSMAQKILQKNIICGNTLTMLDGAGNPMRIPE